MTVLEEVLSLGSEDACDVLIVRDGGVCRRVGMSKLALKNEYGRHADVALGLVRPG